MDKFLHYLLSNINTLPDNQQTISAPTKSLHLLSFLAVKLLLGQHNGPELVKFVLHLANSYNILQGKYWQHYYDLRLDLIHTFEV